nr:hypothetical protein CFP56_16987 [Quercus suber]
MGRIVGDGRKMDMESSLDRAVPGKADAPRPNRPPRIGTCLVEIRGHAGHRSRALHGSASITTRPNDKLQLAHSGLPGILSLPDQAPCSICLTAVSDVLMPARELSVSLASWAYAMAFHVHDLESRGFEGSDAGPLTALELLNVISLSPDSHQFAEVHDKPSVWSPLGHVVRAVI